MMFKINIYFFTSFFFFLFVCLSTLNKEIIVIIIEHICIFLYMLKFQGQIANIKTKWNYLGDQMSKWARSINRDWRVIYVTLLGYRDMLWLWSIFKPFAPFLYKKIDAIALWLLYLPLGLGERVGRKVHAI